MKAVPGRKTDVRDAEWIAQLLEHGLLRPSLLGADWLARRNDQAHARRLVAQLERLGHTVQLDAC